MKKFIPLFSLLLLTSCLNPGEIKNKLEVVNSMRKSIDQRYPDVKIIEAKELIEKKQQKSFSSIIVDCRTQKETQVSTIGGAAPLIGFETFKSRFKDKTIYTFSTIGGKGADYARKLNQQGFNAINLSGGILAWLHAGGKISNLDNRHDAKKVKLLNKAWNLLPEGYHGILP